MWYKNIAGRFFGLVTKYACDRRTERRTDRQNYDSQDRASIAASRGKNGNAKHKMRQQRHRQNCRVKRGYLECKNKKQASLVTRSVIGVLQVEKCHVIINNDTGAVYPHYPRTRTVSRRVHGWSKDASVHRQH